MNKSKKLYKSKIVRKYVEFYPTDKELISYIEQQQRDGLSFATFVKSTIRREIGGENNGNN